MALNWVPQSFGPLVLLSEGELCRFVLTNTEEAELRIVCNANGHLIHQSHGLYLFDGYKRLSEFINDEHTELGRNSN